MIQAASVDLRKTSQEMKIAQLKFILTELSAGMTFAAIALVRKGEAQARNRARARTAYNSALHFLDRVTMTREQLDEVRARLALLKQRLRTLGEGF